MEYLLIAAFLYIVVILLFIYDEDLLDKTAANQKVPIKIIAHRGASGYAPENTIAAFDKAYELKADYLELDVQMSKDGELIVFHDSSLERITKQHGQLKAMNLTSLKQLSAGKWYDESFQEQQIPTLAEVLDRYQHKIGLLIELKDPEMYPGIEKKLATILTKEKFHIRKDHSIIVQSFNQQTIKRFFKMTKTIPTGLLLNFHPSELTTEKLNYLATFTQYLNPPAFWTDQMLIQKIHNAGMKAFCWTVNDKNLFTRIRDMNVDGIITDYPDLPKQILSTKTVEPSTKGYANDNLKETFFDESSLSSLFSSLIYFANGFFKDLQPSTEDELK